MHSDVDLPPCWKQATESEKPDAPDELFLHLDGPGFIGVRGDTVEFLQSSGAEPERYECESPEEKHERIHDLAEEYNDEYY